MHITFDTENLSPLDYRVLAMLGGMATAPADEAEEAVAPAAKKPAAKKAAAKKPEPEPEPEPKPEPEPEPEPAAEEPLPEEVDEVDEVEESDTDDEQSDEDLLSLAVKKATEMVAAGQAEKVREALDAAGANRVRELNTGNVRDFFKALA